MSDLEHQLAGCFQTVFPNLDKTEMETASMTTVREWDSLKMITLIVIIEEEFEIEVPVDEIENLTSYRSLQDFLKRYLTLAVGSDSA